MINGSSLHQSQEGIFYENVNFRFIAILILVIPGFMAMKGFLMMKDAVFIYFRSWG